MRLRVRSTLPVSALVLRRCAQLAQCMQARHVQLCAAGTTFQKSTSVIHRRQSQLLQKYKQLVMHTLRRTAPRVHPFVLVRGDEANQRTDVLQATGGCHMNAWAGRGESRCQTARSSGGS